jgi:hypothetical protein
MMRTNSAIVITAALLAVLPGCASTADSKENSLTIERILTAPLTGIAGRDRVRAELAKNWGIDPSMAKYTNRTPRALADRHVISLLWLEPPPANFVFLGVAPEPCFSVQRALALTQAKPHGGSGKMSAATYDAFKHGMLVSFTSTPDGKCVSAIHIEEYE